MRNHTTMSTFLSLPAEVLHHIFALLEPQDLCALPCVCSRFYAHVADNSGLWRDIYLNYLDKPRDDARMNWQQALRDFVRLKLICARNAASDKEDELEFVHKAVINLLSNASSSGYANNKFKTHSASRNTDFLRSFFAQESTRVAFLEKSSIFERVRLKQPCSLSSDDENKLEMYQRSAQLHCLYGIPLTSIGRMQLLCIHPLACSAVYDMRGYTARTRWGPFRKDGSDRIDWEKVEAVMIVLYYNVSSRRFALKPFRDAWNMPFSGAWPGSYLAGVPNSPKPDISSFALNDPYGIAGTWYRVICFLDYDDFFDHNFPRGAPLPPNMPRPGINVGEATYFIVLKLRVTNIEPPGPEDGQELPVVHFTGDSLMLDQGWNEDDSSLLNGTVRLTREGQVRWSTWSIYHGQEHWRSEGVQIGGVQSARGIVGCWFHSDFDERGPVGPTAIWKVSDAETLYSRFADRMPMAFTIDGTPLVPEDWDSESEIDYTLDEDYDSDDLEAVITKDELESSDI